MINILAAAYFQHFYIRHFNSARPPAAAMRIGMRKMIVVPATILVVTQRGHTAFPQESNILYFLVPAAAMPPESAFARLLAAMLMP